MKNLNCPNCGAPINPDTNKCSYCGTSYFDLSAIDMSSSKPFYLKIKIGKNIITQLVVPNLSNLSLNLRNEYAYCYGRDGAILSSLFTGQNLSTNIEFTAVLDKNNNTLYTVAEDED